MSPLFFVLIECSNPKNLKATNLYYYKQTEHRIYLALCHELLTLHFVKVTRGYV